MPLLFIDRTLIIELFEQITSIDKYFAISLLVLVIISEHFTIVNRFVKYGK